MFILLIIVAGVLGLLVGSFANVVISRMRSGYGLGGRSECPACRTTLAWYELLPIVSFFVQKGRCTACDARISWRYLVVEFVTGIGFALVFWKFGESVLFEPLALVSVVVGFILMGMWVVLVGYDLRHLILPDELVWPFVILALLSVFFPILEGNILQSAVLPSWKALAAGPLIALPFFILWLVSRGTLFGLGDVKLMMGLGWLLGIEQGITAVFFAFWIGTLILVPMKVIHTFSTKKQLGSNGIRSIMKEEVAFAPFLIIGTAVVYLFDINLFTLLIGAA